MGEDIAILFLGGTKIYFITVLFSTLAVSSLNITFSFFFSFLWVLVFIFRFFLFFPILILSQDCTFYFVKHPSCSIHHHSRDK